MSSPQLRYTSAAPRAPVPATVGGLYIFPLSRAEWAAFMVEVCMRARRVPRPRPFIVISANGQVLARNHRDASFRALMSRADAIDADGQSLVHASRLLTRSPLPERVATTDFFHDAAKVASASGLRFYFLGATQENIEAAVTAIRRLYPRLAISGWRNGYFSEQEEPAICKEIVAAGTDVLWVGLGVPRQEAFVMRNREALRGVGWVKTCGGLFDHLHPQSRRAPQWMQEAGLEWLFRMLREPRKYFRRYLTTNGAAFWLLATQTRDPA